MDCRLPIADCRLPIADSIQSPHGSAQSKIVRIGLAQQKWRSNPVKHTALHRGALEAAEPGAQVICLPELMLHHYFGDAMDKALFKLVEPIGNGPTSALCSALARGSGAFVVGSLYEKGEPPWLPLGDKPLYDRYLEMTRSALDSDDFGKAWAEGAAMSLDQAVAYALTTESKNE